jgi:nucleoside 2-deoxyribosyltransferase
MAFDQGDTDQIYDNVIRPVLLRNGVIPIIINRREDNKDINYQIIEQLNKCSFCIADLTYARPSVYYEAGYAQREVEVIYTVRADHLRKDQPEDRRVHFDLQMKPLIKWRSPTDQKFAKKLERRLKKTVLKKLKQSSLENQKSRLEKEKFRSLSINERLKILMRKAIYAFCKAGFDNWIVGWIEFGGFHLTGRHYKNPAVQASRGLTFVARRRLKNKLLIISISGFEKLTVTILKEIRSKFVGTWGRNDILRSCGDEIDKFGITEEYHLFLSLTNTPNSRIMSAMPDLIFQNKSERYFIKKTTVHKPPQALQRNIHLYVISDLDSQTKLKMRIDEIIKNFS